MQQVETLKLSNASIVKIQNDCYVTVNGVKLQIKPSKFMLNLPKTK